MGILVKPCEYCSARKDQGNGKGAKRTHGKRINTYEKRINGMQLELIDNGSDGVIYENNLKHPGELKAGSGITERTLKFNDEASEGFIREIFFDHVRIFYSDSVLKQRVTIKDEADTPSIDMHFNLQGLSGARFEASNKVHSMRENQHNIFYKPGFKGEYYLESRKLQNFEVEMSEPFYNRLLNEASKPLRSLAESIQKKEMASAAPKNLEISPQMKAIIYDIMNCERTGHIKRLFLEAKIIELFMMQVEQTEAGNNKSTNLKKGDIEKVHAAKSVLDNEPLKSFTLMDLALEVGLNDYKLKKGFKEIFGTTVFSYLNKLRMEHAKRMLLDENKAVYEVADALDYSEPHHFSAAFKRTFGYSPSELK